MPCTSSGTFKDVSYPYQIRWRIWLTIYMYTHIRSIGLFTITCCTFRGNSNPLRHFFRIPRWIFVKVLIIISRKFGTSRCMIFIYLVQRFNYLTGSQYIIQLLGDGAERLKLNNKAHVSKMWLLPVKVNNRTKWNLKGLLTKLHAFIFVDSLKLSHNKCYSL